MHPVHKYNLIGVVAFLVLWFVLVGVFYYGLHV